MIYQIWLCVEADKEMLLNRAYLAKKNNSRERELRNEYLKESIATVW